MRGTHLLKKSIFAKKRHHLRYIKPCTYRFFVHNKTKAIFSCTDIKSKKFFFMELGWTAQSNMKQLQVCLDHIHTLCTVTSPILLWNTAIFFWRITVIWMSKISAQNHFQRGTFSDANYWNCIPTDSQLWPQNPCHPYAELQLINLTLLEFLLVLWRCTIFLLVI